MNSNQQLKILLIFCLGRSSLRANLFLLNNILLQQDSTERATKNGESRETGNTGNTRRRITQHNTCGIGEHNYA